MSTTRSSAVHEADDRATLKRLNTVGWDYQDAKSNDYTHGLHPYPAKFIPQIPRRLIQELSAEGEIIADIFCGSGTTLVEALLLNRHAIGVDANPIACLISRAKTAKLTASDLNSLSLLDEHLVELQIDLQQETRLFPPREWPRQLPMDSKSLEFWFEPQVILELAAIRGLIDDLADVPRLLAQAALSSIIVRVSKQDSDTRYVRREKNIPPGKTVRAFLKSLRATKDMSLKFTSDTQASFSAQVFEENVLSSPDIGIVDMVVCSPPYPNAYSYHLYHRTRMLWLGFDSEAFKKIEIGSHRKYSSSNGATAQTFLTEMHHVLAWVAKILKRHGYACFVIGDSIVRGELVRNDLILREAAQEAGFTVEAVLERQLQATRKAFNPKIGKITSERILVFRNARGV